MMMPIDSEARREQGQSVSQATASTLLAIIRSGRFAVGEALPSQRELAQELNVSRPSLREALAILTTSGVISVERGKGTFIREMPSNESLPPIKERWRLEQPYSPEEVFEFRYIAESYAAQLAAMNHTPSEFDEIQRNLETFRRARQRADYAVFVQTDFEFHQLIIKFSQNRLLADIHANFARVMNESQRLPLEVPDRFWQPVIEHEKIVEALAMRDPAGAAYYMRQHLSRACARANLRIKEVI
ncbi:FadR/GntR family transcriptional regulator [Microvirga sp. G4-2]|uniref:FadR/GntR family transcriptional regulator n=1 Tax=Microvirga sp. G4-2 TaxID=3434467 RepID=UPI0040447D2E